MVCTVFVYRSLTKFYVPQLAGLLTRDPRVVERKKPGKAKARKSFQWVKRWSMVFSGTYFTCCCRSKIFYVLLPVKNILRVTAFRPINCDSFILPATSFVIYFLSRGLHLDIFEVVSSFSFLFFWWVGGKGLMHCCCSQFYFWPVRVEQGSFVLLINSTRVGAVICPLENPSW